MSVWFKCRLNPWYIWIPSNPNLYSTKIIMKMRWQTIASNVSIRTISPTATPLPKAYDCVAVYIAGRRTSLVVYGWWPQPPTKNTYQLVNRKARKCSTLYKNRIFQCMGEIFSVWILKDSFVILHKRSYPRFANSLMFIWFWWCFVLFMR